MTSIFRYFNPLEWSIWAISIITMTVFFLFIQSNTVSLFNWFLDWINGLNFLIKGSSVWTGIGHYFCSILWHNRLFIFILWGNDYLLVYDCTHCFIVSNHMDEKPI